MIKYVKFQIVYCIVFATIFYLIFLPLSCYCYEQVQTITITKEDILNAKPVSPYPVKFNSSDLHSIEVMEKRHFPRTYPEFTDNQRLKNLEFELLGRVWEFTPQKDRIERLKLASSNAMLTGTALPATMASKRYVKKMKNDVIQMRERDNVGLIDGFLRLANPELYEKYREHADNMYYKYDKW